MVAKSPSNLRGKGHFLFKMIYQKLNAWPMPVSTDANVIGDIGEDAASAINTVVALRLDKESASPMTVGLNKRASAETDVAKTSAEVVTVLFLLDLYVEKIDKKINK